MTSALKQRIIGAIFLLSLSVIFIPMFFDGEAPRWLNTYYSTMPSAPQFPDLEKPVVTLDTDDKNRSLMTTPHDKDKKSWLSFASKKGQVAIEDINQECWSIKLGTFVKREEALALQEKLQQNGFPAYVREVPRTRLIAVFVGPELVRDNAEAMLQNIKKQLNMEGTVEEFDPVA
jgi:cell division septation protein DedD